MLNQRNQRNQRIVDLNGTEATDSVERKQEFFGTKILDAESKKPKKSKNGRSKRH